MPPKGDFASRVLRMSFTGSADLTGVVLTEVGELRPADPGQRWTTILNCPPRGIHSKPCAECAPRLVFVAGVCKKSQGSGVQLLAYSQAQPESWSGSFLVSAAMPLGF